MQFKSLASFPYSVLGSFSIARFYGLKLKIKLDKQFLLVLLIIFIWKKCIYQVFLEFAYKTLNSSHLRKVFPDFFNRNENLRQFQQKENLRAQIKNRKPLTIGTLAPLLLFNVSIAQVTFAAFEITLSDDRPLPVSLANVVVAYQFHSTLFLKNPVGSSIWNFSIKFKL